MNTLRDMIEPFVRKTGINESQRLLGEQVEKSVRLNAWFSGVKRIKDHQIDALCAAIGLRLEVGAKTGSLRDLIAPHIPERGQRELCRAIHVRGVDSSTLSGWLGGHRHLKDHQIDAICARLGVSLRVVPSRDFSRVRPPASHRPAKK